MPAPAARAAEVRVRPPPFHAGHDSATIGDGGEPWSAALSVFIHEIATAVPPTAYRQSYLRDVMLGQFEGDRRTQNLVRRVYDASGIDQRHSVVEDLNGASGQPLFFGAGAVARTPTTAERNQVYIETSRGLAATVARRLLAAGRLAPADVSHVITVSCTGFHAPDPAYALVRELGLAPSTGRYNIGFMGCFAAFQALQLARALCLADPAAVVMIVCVEICSIHLQLDPAPDNVVSASVFADGAAGALLSARPPATARYYRLEAFATALAEDGEKDMAWTIGDRGFEMVLSRYVPAILQTSLPAALAPLRPLIGDWRSVAHWAVHPGGRAILDKVEQGLELEAEQLAASRRVLARYGNMSSATILFVLRDLLGRPAGAHEESIVAIAFGPGITVESGVLTRLGK